VVGNGGVGKTTYARWLVSRMIEQGRSAILAALDPGTRSLSAWFNDVHQPPGSDSGRIEKFTGEILEFLIDNPQSALLDFGAAGDVALRSVAQGAGGLTEDLEQAAWVLSNPW
jgi:anion-transporting  ArsA/GET3 family ATPase